MTPPPSPKITRRPRLPLIWAVPLVAVAVAVWLFAREWRSYGREIEIEFAHGSGVEATRTKLQYKGIVVGTVKRVELAPDFSGVRVRVQLEREAGALAREGSQFWIVHPEIGFSGISGLEALFGGVHMEVRPGSGALANSFRGTNAPPPPENWDDGHAFFLVADRLSGVQRGAPVKYRDIKVGEVENSHLAPDATAVLIRIRVLSPYVDLVRTDSRFWNSSGLPLQISLFGGRRQPTTLESVITGAIAFATPDELAEAAPDGTQFELHTEPEKAWLEWKPSIPITPLDELPPENLMQELPPLLGDAPAQ